MDALSFVWLELTGKCQLKCIHCYAGSGPEGDHGVMSTDDWLRVIDEAAELGTQMMQFIGGEPTLHPALPSLVTAALDRGVHVEVYSNLVRVPEHLWELFSHPRVALATSYYSDSSAEHAAITRRPTRDRTKANIIEALERSIPLRVSLIDLFGGQRSDHAEAELRALGVTEFGRDHLRQVGRGVRDQAPDKSQLCGDCGRGKVAVSPTGVVWPCVFSRWMPVGNVREQTLAEIITGSAMGEAERELVAVAAPAQDKCCPSSMCNPQCSPSCSPSCSPAGNCRPSGNCAPNY